MEFEGGEIFIDGQYVGRCAGFTLHLSGDRIPEVSAEEWPEVVLEDVLDADMIEGGV